VVYLWEKHDNLLKSLCDAELFDKPQMHGPNKEYGKAAKAKSRAKAIQELKEADLSSMIGEDASMMGIYSDKATVNSFEDYYNNTDIQEYKAPKKKASGDGLSHDALENAIVNGTTENY
jgi:hypothetical protein